MRVLQDEVAGGDGESGVEGIVGVGYLELAGAWEGVGRLEGEDELLIYGEVILVGELDGAVARLHDGLAEEGYRGALRCDGDGKGEGSAIFEGETGGEVIAGAEFGGGGVGWQGQAERVAGGSRVGGGRCGVGGIGSWGEGQVGQSELLDLIEAGSGEFGVGVSSV